MQLQSSGTPAVGAGKAGNTHILCRQPGAGFVDALAQRCVVPPPPLLHRLQRRLLLPGCRLLCRLTLPAMCSTHSARIVNMKLESNAHAP